MNSRSPLGQEDQWQPIETAPKDGTLIVLTWMDDGKPQDQLPMRWSHIMRNGLFPGQVGFWVTPDGWATWNDDIPGGGPTHWKSLQTNGEAVSGSP